MWCVAIFSFHVLTEKPGRRFGRFQNFLLVFCDKKIEGLRDEL